ncbi:MAG: hypothetical protein V3V08_19075 [Nannocystaceae bacterium]
MTSTPVLPGPSLRAFIFVASLVSVVGCGSGSPPRAEGSGETGDYQLPDGRELTSYYPLVDGATWTYSKKNLSGQVSGTEIVTSEAGLWEGQQVVVLTDSESSSGNYTRSTIYRDGNTAVRVHKILANVDTGPYTVVNYNPWFTRADDSWESEGNKAHD